MNNQLKTKNANATDDFITQLQSATGTWPPSAEILEKHTTDKARLKYQSDKYYWERRDRTFAEAKDRARKVIQRNRDGLV